ncbi:PAS domain-containing sensor histidine kinase [Paenibacillus sp. QZ-Y1]|uniref:PAS domain-containing sensor histidine kinase n=1 Tax=Paenibacillus sp. QZ-Y1 TaxID=3414511 RepID=UPI003F78E0E3
MSSARKNRLSGLADQPIDQLLLELDTHITDTEFCSRLKGSLHQLSDLKFALDESSIVALTDRKGKIQYVNDKFCEISQYTREELIGQDHRIINSGYHGKTFMNSLWETISSGRVWNGEIRNRAKDGSHYWVNTTIVPFLDNDSEPYQYLAVRSEVTKLKQVESELQTMMTQVMNIQEEERRRISRELHDGIGQSLFSLVIQMDRLLAEGPQPGVEALRKQVTGIMEDVRGMAWELRPSVLDDLGVVPAIRTYIENYNRHYGIEVDLECNLRKRLDMNREIAMYRIIQEALTNVAKYADVSEARVTVEDSEATTVVKIEDHGAGFSGKTAGNGVGLFSMEERARGAGGTLSITSEPGVGTLITLCLPKLAQ